MSLARHIAKRRSPKPLPNRCGLRKWVGGLKDDAESRGVEIASRYSTTNVGTTSPKAREARQPLTIWFPSVPDAIAVWAISIQLRSGMLGLRLGGGDGGTGLFERDNRVVMTSHKPTHVKPFGLQQSPQIHFPRHTIGSPRHELSKARIQCAKTLSVSHEKPSRKSPDNRTPDICDSIVPDSCGSDSEPFGRLKPFHTSQSVVWILEHMNNAKINPRKPGCFPRIECARSRKPFCLGCLNQHILQRICRISCPRELCGIRNSLIHPCLR